MSDPKPTRRRAVSSASGSFRSGHARRKSRAVMLPKSTHTADEFLQDFLDPGFDPASFLNATLPPLQQNRSAPGRPASSTGGPASGSDVGELSSQAQALITQLNAQTSRLSSTLTQLTDDILRSGSRLAYEVELLRGETLSLTETMNETLQDDIKKFVPGGLQEPTAVATTPRDDSSTTGTPKGADDPDYIKQLQTLTLVRSRLDTVIKTFGDAMEFVFPPSEVSVSSSFLSVSAPEPGSAKQSSEDKGQEVLKKLKEEIQDLLTTPEDPVEGIEKAAQRIEQLKELSRVWKDTAEEKGRTRFIEGLAKMVEDRHREVMREVEQQTTATTMTMQKEGKAEALRSRKASVTRDAAVVVEEAKAGPGGFGLISQLQKLRGGL